VAKPQAFIRTLYGKGSWVAERGYNIQETHPFKGWVFYLKVKVMEEKLNNPIAERSVLIVDDDAGSRDLLIRFLHLIGCEKVIAMTSGEEAIHYLHSHEPSLVLLDYLLPGGMSGLETLKGIKLLRPNLSVIMMTAYPSHGAMLKAFQEGVFDLLVKPLDLRQLEKQISKKLTP